MSGPMAEIVGLSNGRGEVHRYHPCGGGTGFRLSEWDKRAACHRRGRDGTSGAVFCQ